MGWGRGAAAAASSAAGAAAGDGPLASPPPPFAAPLCSPCGQGGWRGGQEHANAPAAARRRPPCGGYRRAGTVHQGRPRRCPPRAPARAAAPSPNPQRTAALAERPREGTYRQNHRCFTVAPVWYGRGALRLKRHRLTRAPPLPAGWSARCASRSRSQSTPDTHPPSTVLRAALGMRMWVAKKIPKGIPRRAAGGTADVGRGWRRPATAGRARPRLVAAAGWRTYPPHAPTTTGRGVTPDGPTTPLHTSRHPACTHRRVRGNVCKRTRGGRGAATARQTARGSVWDPTRFKQTTTTTTKKNRHGFYPS